jgi:hypothetical protein
VFQKTPLFANHEVRQNGNAVWALLERIHMARLFDWIPSAVVGTTFTAVAALKIYGLSRGIVGGRCKRASDRICGSCPSWSRAVNVSVTVLFGLIGLGNLAYLAWIAF